MTHRPLEENSQDLASIDSLGLELVNIKLINMEVVLIVIPNSLLS